MCDMYRVGQAYPHRHLQRHFPSRVILIRTDTDLDMLRNIILKNSAIIYVLGIFFIFQILYIWDTRPLADEVPHFHQIREFALSDTPHINRAITTPVYLHKALSYVLVVSDNLDIHKAMFKLGAAISYVNLDLFLIRLVLLTLTFLLIWYTTYLLKTEDSKSPNIFLLSFILIPIIFPYNPLVYTDVLSAVLIALSVVTAMYGRGAMSATSILLATVLRQPSIAWILIPMIILSSKEPSLDLKSFLRKNIYHLLVLCGFGVFVLVNDGIAVGDRASHELSFNISNIWFFGSIFFLTTIGYMYKGIQQTVTYVRDNFRFAKSFQYILTAIFFLLIYYIFFETYGIYHIYNTERYSMFLRNKILDLTTSIPLAKSIFGAISLLGLASFLGYRFSDVYKVPEYVFKAVSLVLISSMPLIEQRYYIPIFVLAAVFMSTKKSDLEVTIWAKIQTVCNIALALYLYISIVDLKFFI